MSRYGGPNWGCMIVDYWGEASLVKHLTEKGRLPVQVIIKKDDDIFVQHDGEYLLITILFMIEGKVVACKSPSSPCYFLVSPVSLINLGRSP